MENIKNMEKAYSQLYQIETSLRSFIRKRMSETYGPNWYFQACKKTLRFSWKDPFENTYLYDLEVFLHRFSCFADLPKAFSLKLRSIYSIRNQVAHCHLLSQKQFDLLAEAHAFILGNIKTAQSEIKQQA